MLSWITVIAYFYFPQVNGLRLVSSPELSPGWKDVDIATAESRLRRIRDAHNRFPDMCMIMDNSTYGALKPCQANRYMKEYVGDLPDFDEKKFLQLIRNKTISFIGDSVHSQFFENVLCALSSEAQSFERKSSSSNVNHPHLGFHKATFPNGAILQALIFYRMTPGNSEGLFEQELTIKHPIFDADIVVANLGAHMQSLSMLKTDLQKLDSLVTAASKKNGKAPRLLWREYSPPHFMRKEGVDYKKITISESLDYNEPTKELMKKPAGCDGGRKELMSSKFVQFRLTDANEFMKQKGWEILPAFDVAADQPHLHSDGERDCRHWCLGGPVLESWSKALMKILK